MSEPRSTESKIIEDLVGAAANGDRPAQALLFERYWPVIRHAVRACWCRAGGPAMREDASDLDQEVALSVLQALPKQRWQGRQAFKAWLHKLAQARVVDAQRYHLAKRRDVRAETGASGADAASRASPSPESRADLDRRLELLAHLLDELKPQYAGAVMLHHLGYTYEEIGELLETSGEAARKLVSRGEARLVRLRDEHGDD